MNTCCPNCGTEFDPATAAPAATPETATMGAEPPAEGQMLQAIMQEIARVPRGQRKE